LLNNRHALYQHLQKRRPYIRSPDIRYIPVPCAACRLAPFRVGSGEMSLHVKRVASLRPRPPHASTSPGAGTRTPAASSEPFRCCCRCCTCVFPSADSLWTHSW
jgi:hypothetical protein